MCAEGLGDGIGPSRGLGLAFTQRSYSSGEPGQQAGSAELDTPLILRAGARAR